MSIALIGIVFIQYRWIDRAVKEKQELIDNNVYQAVNEVEQKLNDQRAMTFVSDSMFNMFSYDVESIHLDEFGNVLSEEVSHENQLIYTSEDDSNFNMEIRVLTSDDETEWIGNPEIEHHVINHSIEHHIDGDADSATFIEIKEGLGQLENVINKIKLEIHSDHDYRIDSTHIAELLNSELDNKGLGKMTNWGIWDNEKAEYSVQPIINRTDYDIPLFTTDVVDPGRYQLRLSLEKDSIIWGEIWPMIVMSILFVLIITGVFIYSIKLVIKHKKISQIKSDFINNMTHEFKTPLASISLAADSLVHPNTDLTTENVQRFVDIIQSEKNKLNAHVEKILEVAALSKDALDIPIESVNVTELINKVVSNYQLLIEQDKLNLNIQVPDGIMASANAFHLENVLVNLIDNGIKYSNEKAEIEIVADSKERSIAIKDKGIGMSPQQLKKVFDNFYRAQSGDVHDTKGFGLGLSYSKLVMDKMGGSIELSSIEAEGTTAKIYLQA